MVDGKKWPVDGTMTGAEFLEVFRDVEPDDEVYICGDIYGGWSIEVNGEQILWQ